MAKIKITADTKDAQAKVKKLKADVLELQKTIQKRTTMQINADGSRRYTTTETYHSSGRGMKTRYTSVERQTGGSSSSGSGMMGSIVGGVVSGGVGAGIGLLMQNAPVVISALGMAIDKVTNNVFNLQGAFESLKKQMEFLDVIDKPGQTALTRGDSLDALDDERRANNTASIGDEKAWRESFAKTTGTNADQLLQRGKSFFDMATSGNMEEMEKAWKILAPTGITFSDLQNNSTWENLLKLIEAYHKAGEDGMNELEPIMQEIFGRRGMAAIRKAGDGASIRSDFTELRQTYAEYVEPNEQAVLAATDAAEMTRAKAGIIDLGLPAGGERFITQGANDILDVAQRRFAFLGDDRDRLISELNPDVAEFSSEDSTQKEESKNKNSVSISNTYADYRVPPRSKPFYTPAEEPEYKGLFQWDKKRVGDEIHYKAFDPPEWLQWLVAPGPKAAGKLMNASVSSTSSDQNTQALIKVLERNVTTTEHLNTTMQHLNGNSPSMFA